jgi:hypothetical protein
MRYRKALVNPVVSTVGETFEGGLHEWLWALRAPATIGCGIPQPMVARWHCGFRLGLRQQLLHVR